MVQLVQVRIGGHTEGRSAAALAWPEQTLAAGLRLRLPVKQTNRCQLCPAICPPLSLVSLLLLQTYGPQNWSLIAKVRRRPCQNRRPPPPHGRCFPAGPHPCCMARRHLSSSSHPNPMLRKRQGTVTPAAGCCLPGLHPSPAPSPTRRAWAAGATARAAACAGSTSWTLASRRSPSRTKRCVCSVWRGGCRGPLQSLKAPCILLSLACRADDACICACWCCSPVK